MEKVNSNINQEIKGRFVAREIITCFSYEMTAILNAGNHNTGDFDDLATWDEVENVYDEVCSECGEITTYRAKYDNHECTVCHYHEDTPKQAPVEIYEWWIVTSYLYEKLKEKGQPVLEWGNNYYWGRCTTGQAILLDGVISDICIDMEILEGQKYSWEEKKAVV